jgi:hypothetical protein
MEHPIALVSLGLCAVFALLVWAPLGRWILARIGNRLPDPQSLCVPLGTAGWGLLMLALGLVGVLYPLIVLAVAVILILLLKLHRYVLPSYHSPAGYTPSLAARLFIAACAAVSLTYIVLVFASALAPELAFDSLNVHLPYARESANGHRLLFESNNWSSMMPALPLMSYVTAFLFAGANLAKLFNTLCFLLCGGVVYFFARRWWSPLHGIAAAVLFWSCPIALYEATTTLIDLPLTLYSAIAVFSLLEWTRSDDRSFLWLSAVSLGMALGSKYHAAYWIFPFALVMIWRGVERPGASRRETLSLAVRYSIIVAVLFLPWLVRTWYYTGNPVFPIANGYFKSIYFSPEMEAAAKAVYENEGVGRSWTTLLKLPWTVTFHPGSFRGTVGIGFLPGIALALFRRKTPVVRFGLILALLHFYTWALIAQQIRYLLPLVPLLAILSVFGILGDRPDPWSRRQPDTTFATLRSAGVTAGLLAILAAAVLSFPSLYPRWVQEWTYWHSYRPPWKYLFGKESAQDYLRPDIPAIEVYDFINEKLTQDDRVLLLNEASRFYSTVPTLYSFTLEGVRLLREDTEEGVLRRLKDSGITHVLLNYNGIAPIPDVSPRRGVYFFLDKEFQRRYLEAAFSRNNVVLYRLRT